MRKRILLVIFATLLSIPAIVAQRNYPGGPSVQPSRWYDYQRSSYMGIRFGLNVPNVYYKGTGGLAQSHSMPSFHIGLVYGQKLGNGLPFFIETGLHYTEKGTETDATPDTDRRKINLKYLEVPVVIKYKIDTNVDDLSVQPFFGGFLALGVGGKTKCYDSRTKISSFGSDRFKRFDSGIRLGCGLAYQNFYFEMGYDIGLFNIAGSQYSDYHYDNFDGHIHTGNLTVSLGINF